MATGIEPGNFGIQSRQLLFGWFPSLGAFSARRLCVMLWNSNIDGGSLPRRACNRERSVKIDRVLRTACNPRRPGKRPVGLKPLLLSRTSSTSIWPSRTSRSVTLLAFASLATLCSTSCVMRYREYLCLTESMGSCSRTSITGSWCRMRTVYPSAEI